MTSLSLLTLTVSTVFATSGDTGGTPYSAPASSPGEYGSSYTLEEALQWVGLPVEGFGSTALDQPAEINDQISELPTSAPTGLPTFMDLPAAPLDPSISESPTETPTFAPSFMDLEGDVGLVSAEVLPVTNGPSAAPIALTDPASQLPGQGMELPTAAPIAAPLDPTISELPTQSPTSAPTFMDLEAETATPESIVDATLFEDYMQRLAAIFSENKSCFADIVDTISLISSCHDAQTAITYYSPCVIEAVSDVDTFAVQTKTVCGFVGPKYFAEMNSKRWFPTSSSGSEWAPFSWSGVDEGEQETQIGSAADDQTVESSAEPVGSSL